MYQEVKNTLLTALLAAGSIAMQAADLRVDSLRITSPYCMNTPLRTDSTDVWGKAFQQEDLMMDAPMQLGTRPSSTERNIATATSNRCCLAGMMWW